MSLTFCHVCDEYLKKLHAVDSKVSLEHDDGKKRPFLGIVFSLQGLSYYAPLSSPKPRHERISDKALDCFKIWERKDPKNIKQYGVINLNNMIPVDEKYIIAFDIDSIDDNGYKSLLRNQYQIIRKNEEKILKQARRLRTEYEKQPALQQRCCNFPALEEWCQKQDS